MKKATVKALAAELKQLKEQVGDVKVSSFVLWHWEQVAAEIEKHDRYGEIIKAELTHSFEPGVKRHYLLIIWHRPLLNKEKRSALEGRNYYAGLEASADRYFPKKRP